MSVSPWHLVMTTLCVSIPTAASTVNVNQDTEEMGLLVMVKLCVPVKIFLLAYNIMKTAIQDSLYI